MAEPATDLAIRGENVQRIYNYYINRRFIVNRRYQRKLVWTIEEKASFIDSILKEFPVPLILLAERNERAGADFEVIDGMQRLNAIVAFVEGEFAVDGSFFDLDTMADTKLLYDQGTLSQKEPKMDRVICTAIASYTLPLSVYRLDRPEKVDEIFRRINSNGRHLSRQELRQAGSTGKFSQLVRTLAAKIRGDVSASDTLDLNSMKTISITSKDLPYGIQVDYIFWVAQNILTRENVRDSRDEELIADILAYMTLGNKISTSSNTLDAYFGFTRETAATSEPRANANQNAVLPETRYDEMELEVQKITPEVLTARFMYVFDALRSVLSHSDKPFNRLMFPEAGFRVPRYFQAVFLAFYELLLKKNMRVADPKKVISLLDGVGTKYMNIGGGGGKWSGTERQNNVNAVAGVMESGFVPGGPEDPATFSWVTQFENILIQSFTEQNLYDFKQGLHDVDATGKFNEAGYHKIIKTLVAIANDGKGTTGYVLLGVADNEVMAKRIEEIYGVPSQKFNRFYVTGIEHEAVKFHKDLDTYFQFVVQKVASEPIPDEAKSEITRSIKLINYLGKAVIIFKIVGGSKPYSYNETFYVRSGPNIEEVKIAGLQDLFRRFD